MSISSILTEKETSKSEKLPEEVKQCAPVPCDRSRILLVDDEAGILQLFQVILSSAFRGCKVETAENGADAVAAFDRGHHAVILMDLHMPVMDGQTAFAKIEEVCSMKNWEMPAVIFCTGFAPPDTVAKIVEEDSTHGLILKPVSTETLVRAVASRLK